MKKSIYLALVLFAASYSTLAAYNTGNKLKDDLEEYDRKGNTFGAAYGFGYVMGVADTLEILFCIPGGESGVRAGQLPSVVLKYLRENPSILHKAADLLVIEALQKAWPCTNKSRDPGNTPSPAPLAPKPKPKPKKESSPF